MRTFALISQKGGAGKSTLACQFAAIAAERGPTFLVDRDPQNTSSKWYARRQDLDPAPEFPALIDLAGSTLTKAITSLKGEEGTLFIDTRPAVNEPEAEAARVADMVIVPVKPSMNDIEAVGDTLAMLQRIGRRAVLIVNAAKTEPRARDARAALGQWGIPVCPTHIADRMAYLDAALDGRAVGTMKGVAAELANAELRKAWAWIEEKAQ